MVNFCNAAFTEATDNLSTFLGLANLSLVKLSQVIPAFRSICLRFGFVASHWARAVKAYKTFGYCSCKCLLRAESRMYMNPFSSRYICSRTTNSQERSKGSAVKSQCSISDTTGTSIDNTCAHCNCLSEWIIMPYFARVRQNLFVQVFPEHTLQRGVLCAGPGVHFSCVLYYLVFRLNPRIDCALVALAVEGSFFQAL